MIFDSDASKVKRSLNFEFDSWMLRSLKLAITEDDYHSALWQHYPSFPR